MDNLYNQRVLVVDDEPSIREGIHRILTDYTVPIEHDNSEKTISFNVQTAEDGNSAISYLESNPVDIIFLDYKLPDLLGTDIQNWIIKKDLKPLIIMITAFASLEVTITSIRNGIYDFLLKPFEPIDIRERIKKATLCIYHRKKNEALIEEKRQLRFQFLSTIAHELKSPIAAVESNLNLIRHQVIGEELSSYQEYVERSVNRLKGMRKLISNLTDLTRLESGLKKRTMEQTQINLIAQQVIDNHQVMADEKKVTLKLNSNYDGTFYCDSDEIEIILNNLIGNAIKYNREGGTVTVNISLSPKTLQIECCDTGIGIKPEEQNKLFREFCRINDEHARKVRGSGLGLSIVKRIVDLYSGKISIQSEYEKGTTFTIEFPKVVA